MNPTGTKSVHVLERRLVKRRNSSKRYVATKILIRSHPLIEQRPIIRSRTASSVSTRLLPKTKTNQSLSRTIKKEDVLTSCYSDAPTGKDSADDTPWLPRTNLKIYMKSKKTAVIGLKDQDPELQKVIHASYEFGKLALVVGNPNGLLEMSNEAVLKMSTPFGTRGLEHIALLALIRAAERNGYDGEFDIAHRLEAGSETLYIEPLQD